jgi:dolichol-phosphate mannosyltransferase
VKIVIIIPTFNERENIAGLLAALQREFGRIEHEMHVLVVDDDSPDDTQAVVREWMGRGPNIHMITGERQGLGAAYIRGMTHVMAGMNADALFEMDADLSHKPEDVPRLVAALEAGADFVIGSRYVKGGSIPEEWGRLRRVNSLLGNFVARHLAGLHRIKDCTAGFRAIRTSLLSQIDLSALKVQGYAFQIALLYEAVVRGARIVEIPVDFVDRSAGESKLGIADVVEFLKSAVWLRFGSSTGLLQYGIVGASGVLVNLGFFALFLSAGLNKYLASPIAIAVSIAWNLLLNYYWTFRRRQAVDRIGTSGLKFTAVSLSALGISYATFVLLGIAFADVSPYLIQLVGIIPAALLNYFLDPYRPFRQRPAAPGRH